MSECLTKAVRQRIFAWQKKYGEIDPAPGDKSQSGGQRTRLRLWVRILSHPKYRMDMRSNSLPGLIPAPNAGSFEYKKDTGT